MPKKKKTARTASKVSKANDGKQGDEGNLPSQNLQVPKKMQAAMHAIETSTMHQPLPDTGQADCLQLRKAMVDIDSDNETNEQTPSTPDERIPPEFLDRPAFVPSAMDLAKGTLSLETLDAYRWMPINKNDPTLKCINNRPLVKETRTSYEQLSDLIQEQANKFTLASLKKESPRYGSVV